VTGALLVWLPEFVAKPKLTQQQVEGSEKPMSFTQSFQLKKEGENWYVFNDIFRLVYPAA
jgi:hypothetical protein